MPCDVAGDMGRADPPGPEARLLDVDRPDLGPLFVRQHRQIDRARRVIFGEFRRAANVDHRVELGETREISAGQDFDSHTNDLQFGRIAAL